MITNLRIELFEALVPYLCVQLVVHHPLEAPGGVAARGGGEAVLLDVDGEHRVLGLGQLAWTYQHDT